MAKSTDKKFYQQWWFWTIIVIIALAVIAALVALFIFEKQRQNNPGNVIEQETVIAETEQISDDTPTVNSTPLTEAEMVTLCQQTSLSDINAFFRGQGISYSLTNAANPGVSFNDNSSTNADGRIVALLSWNGTNTTTGQPIFFMCYGTKIDDQISLLYLGANGETILGSADSLTSTSSADSTSTDNASSDSNTTNTSTTTE